MFKNIFCNSLKLTTTRTRLKVSLRLCHKTSKKQAKEKPPPKLATDVVNYLESVPDYENIKDKVPRSLLRKYKTPESMYLINRKTAKHIANNIKDNVSVGSPIIEVNPGFGFLTEELLECQSNPIFMYELSNQFSFHLSVSITNRFNKELFL